MIMTNHDAQQKSIRLEALERTSDLITAALSLVAALAWNDAVQTLFKMLFGEAASVYAKFLYAVLVTLVIITVTRYLTRLSRLGHEQLEHHAAAKKAQS